MPELDPVESNPSASAAAAERLAAQLADLDRALRTRVVGQDAVVRQVVNALLAGGHVLLEGVPGLGKTLLVKTLAEATGLSFGRVQFTPDLMPADVTGSQVLDPQGQNLRFDPGPVFAHLLLADEINRATPRTQSALLEAMQERSVTVAGRSHPLPSPFFVLATQNPLEQEGTYPLPEAQLDRFLYKVVVPMPGEEELAAIALRTTGGEEEPVPQALTAADLVQAGEWVRQVVVAPPVLQYAVRLITATHPDRTPVPEVQRYARFGAGPRGLQALVLGAKVEALRDGRWGVAFSDLKAVAVPALRHRIAINFEGQAEGVGPEDLVERILEAVRPEVP